MNMGCYKKFIGCKFFDKALTMALKNVKNASIYVYIFAHLLDLNEKSDEQTKEVHKFVHNNKMIEWKNKKARDLYKEIFDPINFKDATTSLSYDTDINHGTLADWEKFLLERSFYEQDDRLLRNLVVLRDSETDFEIPPLHSDNYEDVLSELHSEDAVAIKNTKKNP